MQTLEDITRVEMIRVPHFELDSFQKNILDNLYLEFFLEQCRVLVTPDLSYMTTGPASTEELERLEELLASENETLDKLKWYLLYLTQIVQVVGGWCLRCLAHVRLHCGPS